MTKNLPGWANRKINISGECKWVWESMIMIMMMLMMIMVIMEEEDVHVGATGALSWELMLTTQ